MRLDLLDGELLLFARRAQDFADGLAFVIHASPPVAPSSHGARRAVNLP
jgi:hypothetical protein